MSERAQHLHNQTGNVHLPIEYDIVMSLLSGQFVRRCYSCDSQQRFQKDRQTIVDCIRHFNVFITPMVRNRTQKLVTNQQLVSLS